MYLVLLDQRQPDPLALLVEHAKRANPPGIVAWPAPTRLEMRNLLPERYVRARVRCIESANKVRDHRKQQVVPRDGFDAVLLQLLETLEERHPVGFGPVECDVRDSALDRCKV